MLNRPSHADKMLELLVLSVKQKRRWHEMIDQAPGQFASNAIAKRAYFIDISVL